MKAWRVFVFIGACLLLADISTVLTLRPSVVKQKSALQGSSTKDLHSDSADEENGYNDVTDGTASTIAPVTLDESSTEPAIIQTTTSSTIAPVTLNESSTEPAINQTTFSSTIAPVTLNESSTEPAINQTTTSSTIAPVTLNESSTEPVIIQTTTSSTIAPVTLKKSSTEPATIQTTNSPLPTKKIISASKRLTPALYKRGSLELVMAGQPFGKYAIPCSEEIPSDCPQGSTCEFGNLCWCKNKRSLRAKRNGKEHDSCIDLKFPCANEKLSPCHRNASCEYYHQETFYCKCNERSLGNGEICKENPDLPPITEPATMTSKVSFTYRTHKSTRKPKPTQLQEFLLNKALIVYHIVLGHIKKRLKIAIIGAAGLGLIILTITICLCRRRIRRKREKSMGDGSHEGFQQQEFSSYPVYDEPVYETIMDKELGPLPPTPAPPPPPPPPPPPSAPPLPKAKSMHEKKP